MSATGSFWRRILHRIFSYLVSWLFNSLLLFYLDMVRLAFYVRNEL